MKSGRHNNASEVVSDALRLAQPMAEDIGADLTGEHLLGVRVRVLSGIESIERGEYADYEGPEGLKRLSEGVKARGRKLLTVFRVSKDVEGDLGEIFLYWAQRASFQVADRIIDGTADRFSLLCEHPNAGAPSEDIGAGVRSFPTGKYLIYRKARRGTEILHIFDGARNQKRALPLQNSNDDHCVRSVADRAPTAQWNQVDRGSNDGIA